MAKSVVTTPRYSSKVRNVTQFDALDATDKWTTLVRLNTRCKVLTQRLLADMGCFAGASLICWELPKLCGTAALGCVL